MNQLLNQINQLFETQATFVLATIWSITGTSPDSVGARLVVTDCNHYGQLQSTHRQKSILHQCRQMLSNDIDYWLEKDYPLGKVAGVFNGHCTVVFEKFNGTAATPDWFIDLCRSVHDGHSPVLANQISQQGGKITSNHDVIYNTSDLFNDEKTQTRVDVHSVNSRTLFQLIKEPHQSIAVVGRSQVSESLVRQLALLPFEIQWLTDSPSPALAATNLQHMVLNDQAIGSLNTGAKIAIATNDHDLDMHCCYLALRNTKLAYVGCLGSQKKADLVKARLIDMGIPTSRLSALCMPVGLGSITGKQPSVIAASIVAQLLSLS